MTRPEDPPRVQVLLEPHPFRNNIKMAHPALAPSPLPLLPADLLAVLALKVGDHVVERPAAVLVPQLAGLVVPDRVY